MALNFPASPVDGQIYYDTASGNRYVYDAATTKWSYTANNTPTGSVYLSASAPPGAVAGDLWWHQDLGTMFIFYNDGDSTQWVETSPSGGFSDVAASFQTINAAFGVANAAFDSANNVAPQVAPSYNTANAAYTQANAAYSFANGVATNAAAAFAAANNVAPQVTPAFNTANAAFAKANSANVLAYNTGIGANNYAGVMANAANDFAYAGYTNVSFVLSTNMANNATSANNYAGAMANGAGTIANAAFAAANAEYTFSNTIYAAVNSAFAVINAAYTSSNADYVVTNAAFAVANAAYGNANNLAISANAYSGAMANAGNAYTVVVGASSNTYANNTFLKLVATTQTITGDLSITGNLSLLGGSTIISSNTLSIGDSLIYLAGNNYSGTDLVDIGFIANYGNATSANVHTGLIRDATNKQYYLFSGYDQEPANNTFVPGTNNMVNAVLVADLNTSNLTLGGANAIVWIKTAYDTVNAAYTSSNADYTLTNAVYAAVNSAFGVINAAYTSSNADYVVSNAAFAKANAALANTSGVVFNGSLTLGGGASSILVLADRNTSITGVSGIYRSNNVTRLWDSVVSDVIAFSNTGRVGIATTNPGYTLDVAGDVRSNTVYRLENGTVTANWQLNGTSESILNTVSNHPMAFRTNNTERMRIDATGNVLIGTATATSAYPMTVYDSTNGGIAFRNPVGFTGLAHNGNDFYFDIARGTAAAGNLVFRNSSSLTENMRITNTGRIGIGTSTPSYKFHVSTGASGGFALFEGLSRKLFLEDSGDAVRLSTEGTGPLTLRAAGSGGNHLSIDSSGRVTMPSQPAFFAARTSGNVTGPTVFLFNNVITYIGNHYDSSTGRFTAPVAGNYLFNSFMLTVSSTARCQWSIRKNGVQLVLGEQSGSTAFQNGSISAIFSLAAGDYVDIYVNTSGDTAYGSGYNGFIGKLIS
jgi:hypothetical protein